MRRLRLDPPVFSAQVAPFKQVVFRQRTLPVDLLKQAVLRLAVDRLLLRERELDGLAVAESHTHTTTAHG